MSQTISIRDTFFEECEELLEAVAEGLQRIERGEADAETVNAVFRAVHSIKGGAGAFALKDLVGFAHGYETVLDALRSDRIAMSPDLLHVLLRSFDHLAHQVESAQQDRAVDPSVTAGFIANLEACLGDQPLSPPPDPAEDFAFAAVALDFGALDLGAAEETAWALFFAPQAALYANGHDPALLFAALADLGRIEVNLDLSALPPWDGFDPAGSYLAWRIRLWTDAPEAALREVFDFVEGLCTLDIAQELPEAKAPPAVSPPAVSLPQPGLPQPGLPQPDLPQPDLPQPRRETSRAAEDEATAPKPTLRVDLDRVDRLINAVGELIINQAMIEQSIQDLSLATDAEVTTHVEDYRLLARDIQEAVMAIRAQPVKPLFQRMSRIVREAAEATGKSARLVTQGEATEVDKTVIERLADPLTHMIRNAVDHGLETPEARRAAGKDPEGTILLSAAHRSGSVVITVRDDGAGLNRQRIRDKALAKGLIAAEADLSDGEIDNLLFMPGFSTAETISNLSGRGVGLDVVKNAVTALGGKVGITSQPGHGTEFTITLPLTLAVMDGMVIGVAGQTMVIPVASVIETIRPGPQDLHRIGTGETLLQIRGRFLPMIDVALALGFTRRGTDEAPLLLLVEAENLSQRALIVDAVHDQRQVVIKGLEANYGGIPGVSAATVLGDGQIALILDAEALTSDRLLQTLPRNTGGLHA